MFLQTANAGYSINYKDSGGDLTVNITHSGDPKNPISTSVDDGKKYELEISGQGVPSLRAAS